MSISFERLKQVNGKTVPILYSHNQFEDYLFLNTKFDTPSSSKHGFGDIYQDGGKFFLKLNLQIRFS
ncbi:HpaII family restriction endonuclease [Neisseria leonii]|uniref:HpaII family restriction endonuclease n=1 Tax=Neisseria leonii TaxID=2995413 RepID=UPI00237B7885|nr:HpaII family restriction endonuclease [Neisseria sp. 3986]MDD9326404.1 HpaII family restriction endonuclease [Neisseria sp. 3986]